MELINDSKWFDPPDVEEEDEDEVEPLTKEEIKDLIGEIKYEKSREK